MAHKIDHKIVLLYDTAATVIEEGEKLLKYRQA